MGTDSFLFDMCLAWSILSLISFAGGGNMPSIFKALASITAWILFVFGILVLVAGFGRIIGASTGAASPEVDLMTAYFSIGLASLFLSVMVMRIRKKLE